MSNTQTTEPAKLRAFEITFRGRQVGAIGAAHEITTSRFAHSPAEAIQLCYEPLPVAYEHVTGVEVREVPSPFGWEGLYNHVTNTRESLEQFTHWVRMMTSEMSRIARRVAKEGKDWHDDPGASEHPLYHAPTDQVYPPAVQIVAIAELVTYLLRETPAGLPICDRLSLPDDKPFASAYPLASYTPKGERKGEKGGA